MRHLHDAWPAWALVLLLAVPAAAQGPDGARAPVGFDGNVLDVALASQTERPAVATSDPGSNLPTAEHPAGNPDEDTWFLLTPDGRQFPQSGGADPSTCDSPLTTDDCKSDARFIASDSTGSRVVVGSSTDSGSELVFVTFAGGEVGRDSFPGTLTGLAISDNGDTVAATWSSTTGNPGRLHLYTWASPWNPTGTDTFGAAPTDLALSPDGQRISVAVGEDHHRFKRNNNALSGETVDGSISGTVTAVAMSNSAKHVSVAGSSQGYFAAYSDDTAGGQREFRVRDQQDAVAALAIRRDATAVAVGYATGDLWIHGLDPGLLALSGTPVHLKLAAGITELAFASDGLTVAAATSSGVAQVGLSGNTASILWQSSVASPMGLAVAATGEVVATGSGKELRLFGAQHAADFVLPAKPKLSPGGEGAYSLSLRNTGNRIENASLSVSAPAGWTAALVPSTALVAPGQSANLTLTVRAPDEVAPGTVTLELRRDLRRGAGAQRTDFPVEVTAKKALVFPQALASTGIQPGQTKEVEVEVRNQGNVAQVARLVPTIDRAGWTVAAGAAPAIQPGATGMASLVVTAPSDARELDPVKVRASLEGHPDASYELRVLVGARFTLELAAPATLAVPAAGASLEVAVTNRGNAVDTVRLGFGPLPTGWTARWPSGENPHTLAAIEPGGQGKATLVVEPPADAAAGTPIQLQLTATSQGDDTQSTTRTVLLAYEGGAGGTDTGTSSGKGSPGLELPLAVLAVALVAARRRLASKGP